MLRAAIISVALVLPAAAQETDPQVEEGFDLLDRGTRLLFQEFMERMDPAFDELQNALRNIDRYHAPEVLPNGDIIIRRKDPLTPEIDPERGIDL